MVDGVGCRLNFKSSRVTVGTSKTARKLGISFPFVADATQASAAQVEEQVRARSGFDALAARVAADLAANRAAAADALVEPSSAEPAQAAAWLQEELSASNDVIERGKRSRQQVVSSSSPMVTGCATSRWVTAAALAEATGRSAPAGAQRGSSSRLLSSSAGFIR